MKPSTIFFEKRVAAGNDFIVIDDRSASFQGDPKKFALTVCDRKHGSFGINQKAILIHLSAADDTSAVSLKFHYESYSSSISRL